MGKRKPQPSSSITVEMVPLSELIRWPRNPKDHDLGALMESYGQFGYVAPIIVNSRNKTILAGHGRLDTLWTGFNAEEPPPHRVEDISSADRREWLVPVVMIDLEEDLHEAYVVADNRLTERGGWDWGMLPDVLTDLKDRDLLDSTGFDGDDLDAMLKWRDGDSFGGHKEVGADVAGQVEMGACPGCGAEFAMGQARKKFLARRGRTT